MRILTAVFMLVLLGTFAPPNLYTPLPVPARTWVGFTPLDGGALAGCRLDGMMFEAGWVLTSNHPRFGGLSGLHVEKGRVLAITDAGEAAAFDLSTSGDVPLAMSALADPTLPKKNRDAEALAVAGGAAWVTFERSNAIRRYRLPGWQLTGDARPAAMAGWPNNAGAEAMVRSAGDRFMVFAERTGEVLLFGGDPVQGGVPQRLRYQAPTGFRPVDADVLADGRLLVLHRRFRWSEGLNGFATALSVLDPVSLRGEEIARLEAPCLHDNFEGVSVSHDNGRETVWLASDDNLSPYQRTLLLKFVLQP